MNLFYRLALTLGLATAPLSCGGEDSNVPGIREEEPNLEQRTRTGSLPPDPLTNFGPENQDIPDDSNSGNSYNPPVVTGGENVLDPVEGEQEPYREPEIISEGEGEENPIYEGGEGEESIEDPESQGNLPPVVYGCDEDHEKDENGICIYRGLAGTGAFRYGITLNLGYDCEAEDIREVFPCTSHRQPYDPDGGDIVRYELKDESVRVWSDIPILSMVADNPGTYNEELTVEDDEGERTTIPLKFILIRE